MNSKLFFLLLFSSLVALHGCDKIEEPEPDEPLTLIDFLNNNKPALQTFHVTAGTTATITGAKGAVISFGANSFFNSSGVAVTSGDVEIQLREVTTKKDMVLSQTPTLSYGQELIVSQGMYFLKALQNGFELIVKDFEIKKNWAEHPEGQMDVFLGGQFSGNDYFSWSTGEFGLNGYVNYDTTINPLDTFEYNMYIQSTNFLSQNFNWINCDYFYDTIPSRVAVFFPTADSIDVYLFQSYLVFNDLNAVLHYESYSNMQVEFFNIPSGLDATLVTYYIVSGKVYVATANITVSDALSTPITFSETTEQGLLDILGGL